MIPRFRPLYGLAEYAALIPGKAGAVPAYESAFAEVVGARHGIAFPYGRTGLRLLLEAQSWRGGEIICPAYTCVVVPHAVTFSGNTPVFIDSGADGNMDLAAAEAAITPQTRAIIATSIFGHPVDLDRLDALRLRHPHLMVIQDCAHSFACEWNGRPIPLAGDAAVFGCNISKIANSIFGGMVTTDDGELARRLRALRDERLAPAGMSRELVRAAYCIAAGIAFTPTFYGLLDRLRRTGLLSALEDYYQPDVIDMPADHLTAVCQVEARVGSVQIRRLPQFIAARRQWAEFYRAELGDLAQIRFLPSPPGSSYSHIAAVVADPAELFAAARAEGIELGRIIDYNCPEMAAYGGDPRESWPMAGYLARHVINLPAWGRFDLASARKVVAVMRRLLPQRGPAPREPVLANRGTHRV